MRRRAGVDVCLEYGDVQEHLLERADGLDHTARRTLLLGQCRRLQVHNAAQEAAAARVEVERGHKTSVCR